MIKEKKKQKKVFVIVINYFYCYKSFLILKIEAYKQKQQQ
jgi:hypothetical protein